MDTNPDTSSLDICAIAHKHIQSAVDGNGAKSGDVRLSQQHSNAYPITGVLTLNLSPEHKDEVINGQAQNAIECSSAEDKTDLITQDLEQFLQSPETQQYVLSLIKQHPDKGWGLNGQDLDLKEQNKTYAHQQDCTACQGKAEVNCNTCQGKGDIPCNMCKADGYIVCVECKGQRDIMMPDGTEKPCIKCHKKGVIPCLNCRGQKYLPCNNCRGSKTMGCPQCGKTGVQSHVTHVHYKMTPQFTVQFDENFPSDIKSTITQDIGFENLAKDGYLTITHIQGDVAENEQNVFVLNYPTDLIVGDIEFSISGKAYPTTVIGQNGALFNYDDFLDPLVKPGIAALHKISKGPMAAEALLNTAKKFKLINMALGHIARMSKKKLFQKIRHDYPYGLSEKYAKAIVVHADKALLKMTEKPRYTGLGLGASLATILFGGWFFTALRSDILSKIAADPVVLDLGLLLVGCGLMVFGAKIFAQNKLKSLLGGQSKSGLKTGSIEYSACFILIFVFLVLAKLCPEPPLWLPI